MGRMLLDCFLPWSLPTQTEVGSFSLTECIVTNAMGSSAHNDTGHFVSTRMLLFITCSVGLDQKDQACTHRSSQDPECNSGVTSVDFHCKVVVGMQLCGKSRVQDWP